MPLDPVFVPTEHQEQVRFVKELELAYPDLRFFAIPNGGHRSRTTALDLLAEGVSPGVPDLFIPAHHLFVEMKRRQQGRLSPAQKSWIAHLESIGYTVVIGYGCDDALAKVRAVIERKGEHSLISR